MVAFQQTGFSHADSKKQAIIIGVAFYKRHQSQRRLQAARADHGSPEQAPLRRFILETDPRSG
jgi:hypothetical protein